MLTDEIQQAIATQLQAIASNRQYRHYEGENSERLADELRTLSRCQYVQLCSSGTAAMETLLRAIGVKAGDRVLLSAYDYPGNFWAIERAGGRPVLVDVQADTWCLSLEQVQQALANADSRPKVVIASHLHGCMQPMRQLHALCDEQDVVLVEDACQSIGASIGGQPAGSFGAAGIFSFGGGKVVSAGRGGALVTNDESIAHRVRLAAGAGSGPYGLSEVQAALAVAQMPFLSRINEQCQQFFFELAVEITRDGFLLPWANNNAECGFYQAGLLLAESQLGSSEGWLLPVEDLPLGNGFPGFHRRSRRRCDRVGELPNTTSIVERQATIHHSFALDGRLTPAELSQQIRSALSWRK